MTAPSSPVALLDQLDELRANATPGPWRQDDEYPEDIVAPRTAGLDVASCDEGPADAALIVGAVNAVGPLAAAMRAVLELHQPEDGDPQDIGGLICDHCRRMWPCATIRALSVTP